MKGAPPTKNMIATQMGEIIRTVDEHAKEINRRWGFNRLPHIVPIDLTLKFKRQHAAWREACFECAGSMLPADIERVQALGEAMLRAFEVLERTAIEAGKAPSAPGTWEFELKNGTPVILVRERSELGRTDRKRGAQVWALEEIAEIIERFPELSQAKSLFPDAEIIKMSTPSEVRELVDDALNDIPFD